MYEPDFMSDSMVRRCCGQFTEGRTNVNNEDHSGQLVPGDARTDRKCAANILVEPALHNFGVEVQTVVTSWLQLLAVDSYDTGTQKLVY